MPVVSMEQALELIAQHARPLPTERIALSQALGRVLASPAYATTPIPPFDTSKMDGFALDATGCEELSPAAPLVLEVVGHIGAGDTFEGTCQPGQCIRIMTGAAVPPSLNAVIKVEDTTLVSGSGSTGSFISYDQPINPGQFIKPQGIEVGLNEEIVQPGIPLTPRHLGALASAGYATVEVYRMPKVAVIPLGSELVPIDQPLKPGQIKSSSYYALCGLAREAGATIVEQTIAPDDPQIIRQALIDAAAQADIIVTSGGSARGDYDYIVRCIESCGTLLFDGVAALPSKTQGFGLVNGALVFSMPGQPGAALLGLELFAQRAIRIMGGYAHPQHPTVQATLAEDTALGRKEPTWPQYLRGELFVDDSGHLLVRKPAPVPPDLFGSQAPVNCIMVLPAGNEPRRAGRSIECWVL